MSVNVVTCCLFYKDALSSGATLVIFRLDRKIHLEVVIATHCFLKWLARSPRLRLSSKKQCLAITLLKINAACALQRQGILVYSMDTPLSRSMTKVFQQSNV